MSCSFDTISSADLNKIPDLIDGMQSDLKGSMGKKGISYFLTIVINRIPDRGAYISMYTKNMDILNKRWKEWKGQHATKQDKIKEYEEKLIKCEAYLNLMKNLLSINVKSVPASSSQTPPQEIPERIDGHFLSTTFGDRFIENKVFNPSIIYILSKISGCNLELGLQGIDNEIQTFRDEQIATFIEFAVRDGIIDPESAQKVRNNFKHIITGLGTLERPSLSYLRDLYDSLNNQIEKHVLKARENGKKVLILVGEDHIDRKSLIVEMMILDIVNRLGIKNLLTETDHKTLDDMKHDFANDLTSLNFLFALKIAKKLGLKTIPCDPKLYSSNEVRFAAMNQAITKADTDSTFIVNVGLMHHICTDKAINSAYEVLSINASNIGELKLSHLLQDVLSTESLTFAFNPENAIQANVPGNPYSLRFEELEELILLIKGKTGGQVFVEPDPNSWREIHQFITNLASSSIRTTPFKLKRSGKCHSMKLGPKPCAPQPCSPQPCSSDMNAESLGFSFDRPKPEGSKSTLKSL